MTSEQARGKPVDKRADIWAFGVVLWEMLTGRQLFGGGEGGMGEVWRACRTPSQGMRTGWRGPRTTTTRLCPPLWTTIHSRRFPESMPCFRK